MGRSGLVRGGVDDVRTVARGWRWGRRSLVPRSAEQYVEDVEASVFPTTWSRKAPAIALREVAQKGALEPLFRSQVRVHAEGLDVLSRVAGPVIFVANHASHLDTPLILLSLPDEWRRKTAVAAAADYFFDTWWRAVGSAPPTCPAVRTPSSRRRSFLLDRRRTTSRGAATGPRRRRGARATRDGTRHRCSCPRSPSPRRGRRRG
jgi:hypothetical protein